MNSVSVRDLETVPATLQALCRKNADKVCAVSNETGYGNGYWIYLRPGWVWEGSHCIHEDTVALCRRRFRHVVPE